jgi:hypothetical protein
MMDRNEISQNSRSDDLLWGHPITAIQINSDPIDEWFKTIDLDELCKEEFTFSKCKTSQGVEENNHVDYNVVNDLIFDEFSIYLESLGPKEMLKSVLEVPWINIYEEHGFQDAHDHQGSKFSDFAWCYVHQAGDSHIVFKNKHASNSEVCLGEFLQAYDTSVNYVPTIKGKGTVYFFPAHIYHAVSPNLSTTPRITISGNIRIKGTGVLRVEDVNLKG